MSCLLIATPAHGEKLASWEVVIRNTPYWQSQGMAKNLRTLRRWVLLGEAYCNKPHRHILFDRRGAFLTWMDDEATPRATQASIDRLRQELAQRGKIEQWTPGGLEQVGYPFALACDQPHVDVDDAIARLLGDKTEYRVWGTWDDLAIGTDRNPVARAQKARHAAAHVNLDGKGAHAAF